MDGSSKAINKVSILKQIPIFSKLNWFDLHLIASKCSLAEYKKGDIVCREGSPADAFYCLVSGRLLAYVTNPQRQRERVELIRRGVYFGIISLLTGESHSLTFEAINDSILIKIEKEDFHVVLKTVPSLGVEFSRSLSRRIKRRELNLKSVFESTIISIYSPVQGSGSSTYATNLALSLKEETGKKVILVSIDSKPRILREPSDLPPTVPHWKVPAVDLKDIIGDDRKILASVRQSASQIDILNVTFDTQNFSLVSRIGYFVGVLANDYHFVVVDLPNQMDDVVLKTLIQSDVVQLVTTDRSKDLPQMRQVLEKLQESLKETFSQERVSVILNCLSSQSHLSSELVCEAINYRLTAVLPFIESSQKWLSLDLEHMTVTVPDPKSFYAKTVRAVARKTGGVLVGLVLGGGAALGLAHIGIIRVLEKENIPIDIVVGSSMGAVIGGLWATGSDAQGLTQIANEFKERSAIFRLLDPIFPKAGIIGGYAIIRWLKKHIGDKTFYDARIPLKIVAYDLAQREELIIDQGSIIDAVRKSIAIPGVIEPIVSGERLIIDGGILNPLPTNVLTSLGVNKIIAVNVLPSPEDVLRSNEIAKQQRKENLGMTFSKSPWKYLHYRLTIFLEKIFYPNISDIIVRSLQATGYIIAEQSGTHADVVIHPDLAGVDWFELYRGEDLMKRGEDAALKHLVEIRKLISDPV